MSFMRPAAVAAAYALSLALAVSFSTPRRVGDGGEYLVMAQRLAAFQAPVVTSKELDEFKTSLRTLGSGFESSLLDYPSMVGPDGRQAFLHFWLYPFLVVPGLWIAQLFQLHPNWAFTLTNIAMLAVAVFVVARRAPPIAIVYLFLGPIVWWADKAHTEAFLFGALAIAVVCIESSPAAAMASWSLAGAQNASIGVVYPIFAGLAFAVSRHRHRWTAREFIAAATGAVLIALPMLYNWSRVGKVSPMTEYAHLSAPSLAGLLAFLGEPNIGIIVNAPAYMIALVGLLAAVRAPARSGGNWWWPAVITILLLFIWSQNPNANHGGTPGVNRWVLALLPLSLPWVTGPYALYGRTLRSVLAATIAVLSVSSAYWHLPSLPENYLNPTGTARMLWSRGWLHLTPAEVFAERTAHSEGPALPLADETCGVSLVWDLQSPVACIPPATQLPSECAGVDGFCFAVSRDDAIGVIHAPYNGFFFRADARSWPAAGPLASGVRSVLLALDSDTHRWEVANERRWVRDRREVDVRAVLERPGRVFFFIAHTGSSPSLVLRAPPGTEAVLHRLNPLQTISTTATVDGALTVGLPADATNLAVALRSPR
jgi:hypothetical protein